MISIKEEYEALMENFEKSEEVRREQKELIATLRREIDRLRTSKITKSVSFTTDEPTILRPKSSNCNRIAPNGKAVGKSKKAKLAKAGRKL